jgi:N-methylhydantoinase A/oxoprolinase/acetone carboxylase beta subunit
MNAKATPTAACRLAVDIGGTFTDAVLETGSTRFTRKVLTTPANPAEGFMAAVEYVLAAGNVGPGHVGLILHGTTLATNALIERKGAKTALIVTEGHRDSLEMAYENRFDQYDIQAERPAPLVPRDLRWPVAERLDWHGRVLTPLDEDSFVAWLPEIERQGVESLAVGLLHAYANPAHERRIAEIVEAAYPDLLVSLASEVCPEVREYDRQSTTVANAYVQPLIARYLADLEARLAARGFACPCLLMTSGGSLVTIATAAAHPIRLVESGPAGGAVLASAIARELGEDRVLSFDMGGTTAKICLIDDGEPLLSRSFEVDRAHRFMKGSGLPVKIPVVEMVEIGAGGGSIAQADALGRIAVGPESAGADPGPVCYGRGATQATVTDANLALGRIDPEDFAGGTMTLDAATAHAALARDPGETLHLDAAGAALGVIEIVDENMASAARVHAVERGKEVAGRTMIAFGGAAPLHAGRLAEKLGIERVIVPGDAGVGSAVGFLTAPVAYEVIRSRYGKLSDLDPEDLGQLFEAMREEANAVVRLGAPEGPLSEIRHAYLRYVGQGHEVKVTLPDDPEDPSGAVDAEGLRRAFEAEYRAQYGRTVPDLDIEALTWSLTVAAPRPTGGQIPTTPKEVPAPEASQRRSLMAPDTDGAMDAAVHRRSELVPGMTIAGPALVVEDQTTTVVPSEATATVNGRGDLVLRRGEAKVCDGSGHRAATASSELRRQVIWNRMISIVEEQAQALIRTAFSTTVREAGDLSAGIFDLGGRMLAQAVTGTPGHVNAMAASVGCFLERYPPEVMREGDVYVTNDPWQGTGHLFDFTAVTPTFRAGRPVALFACTVHVVDIGGLGFGPDAGQVYEEGLCIPIMPLFGGGEVNRSLLAIIRANVREPDQVVGDLYSLAACNDVGSRRLVEMMDAFALEALDEPGDYIIETSRAAMLAEIASLPAGQFDNVMTVDGFDRPVRLQARMTVAADGIAIDFDGTSVRHPLHHRRRHSKQCRIAGTDPGDGSGRFDPQRRAPLRSGDPSRGRPDAARRCLGMPRSGSARPGARRRELEPVEPHALRRPRFGRCGRPRTRHALLRHHLPLRRNRRAARQGRAVRHRLPLRGQEHAGRDHRNGGAAHIPAQGAAGGLRRRRAVSRRPRPDDRNRPRRGRALRRLRPLRPHRPSGAGPGRRPGRRRGPCGARQRRDPEGQRQADSPGRRLSGAGTARRRRPGRSARPGGEPGRRGAAQGPRLKRCVLIGTGRHDR